MTRAIRRSALLPLTLIAAFGLVGLHGAGAPARADETYTLKVATLAPAGSKWMRVFRAWAGSVKKETDGRLTLRFYPGSAANSETEFLRKVKAGQLDGASLTSAGLGEIAPKALVLQLPGLLTSYDALDRARTRLDDELEAVVRESGYEVLGWADAGKVRIFSKDPVKMPADLAAAKPWAAPNDRIFPELLDAAGAEPVRLPVGKVYSGLQSGRVTAVPASALAAVSMQWFTEVEHVRKQPTSIIVGATVVDREAFDALPSELQRTLKETGKRAHAALRRKVRQMDQQAYQTILAGGVEEVDTSAQDAAWQSVYRKVRRKLRGSLVPPSLLRQVEGS